MCGVIIPNTFTKYDTNSNFEKSYFNVNLSVKGTQFECLMGVFASVCVQAYKTPHYMKLLLMYKINFIISIRQFSDECPQL